MVKFEDKKGNDKYCEYFLGHMEGNPIGDDHVFPFLEGEFILCDRNGLKDCKYGNNSRDNLLLSGGGPGVGVCESYGLKVAEKINSNLTERINQKDL